MNKIKLLQSFQKIFEKKKIKEKDNLEKIGLDSLKMLEIMAFNDEKFNNNSLRSKGDINFYVPASHYGYVECLHHFLCHSLIDVINSTKLDSKERISVYE